MSKKSFKENPALAYINTGSEEHDTHDTQDAHNEHTEPEAPREQSTQGRKGHKLPRINMAFTLSNHEYLQIISRIEGMSITEYVNKLIKDDSINRKDLVEEAKRLLK